MKARYALTLVVPLACLVFFVMLQTAFTQEDRKLDDILNGFEDDNDKPSDDLTDTMEGFEEGEKTEKTSEDTDDVLDGFEDETEDTERVESEKTALPDWLSIDGYFKISSVYSYLDHDAAGTDTDWQGLTRLRTELKLELDTDLSEIWQARVSGHAIYDFAYAINGRENYTAEVRDDYEAELEFDEVYLQGSLTKKLDLKAGRQIVVWGRSDNLRVTDVLNPLDLRWPGLVDIEKLRLPVIMTKLDYYVSGWSLSGIAIHEVRYNKNPVFGSDFFAGTEPLPDTESPDEGFDVDNTQFAASLNGIFSGWDVSFYLADIYTQLGTQSPASQSPATPSEIKHPKIKMAGGAFNIAWGNWLFKSEAAYFDGFEFTNTPGKAYSRLDALAGVEYSGISDATLTLEIANRHYFDFDDRIENRPDFQKENLFEWALRFTKPYLNDTLNVTFLSTIFGPSAEDGGFQRFTAEYDLTDLIELTGGIVFYQSGDLRRTLDIGDNDRVFIEIQYNF